MLKKLFGSIGFAMLLLASVPASAGERCANARCVAAHRPQQARPAVPDEVCIPFIQPEPGVVVLTIKLGNGETRRYSRPKGRGDFYCIGRHWLTREGATKVELCNQFVGNDEYFGEDLAKLARKPKDSRVLTACLYGKQKCGQMGFKMMP